jgi:hypothetical protein
MAPLGTLISWEIRVLENEIKSVVNINGANFFMEKSPRIFFE